MLFILYNSYQELSKLHLHRNEETEKVDNFSSVTWKHFEQSQSCFKPIKNQEEKKTYPGNMEENSNYPEAIILSGESKNLKCLKMVINIFYVSLAQLRSGPTVDERWILLLGQWLHQGGSYYRR